MTPSHLARKVPFDIGKSLPKTAQQSLSNRTHDVQIIENDDSKQTIYERSEVSRRVVRHGGGES